MLLPNILITGTPGTGKTSLSAALAAECPELTHLNVGDLIKQQELHDGYNAEFDCNTLNEDKVCDALEPLMAKGGQIVDFHSCAFFPERWFQLVLVLRCSTESLFDRLTKRQYSDAKRRENLEAEIMQVCEDEARESYEAEIVQILQNDTVDEAESNVQRCVQWLQAYKQQHQ